MYPRKMDAEEFIRIGGRVVREQQTESSGAGHIRVLGLGGGKYDPHIAAKLNSLKSSLKATLTEMGETSPDAQIADALSIIRSGGVPSGPLARAKPASLLAAISRLIFHVEPGRSPSALVTSWMSVDTSASGSGTVTKAVTEGPMTGTGANPAARGAGARVQVPVPSDTKSIASRPKIEAFLQQEKEVAIAYVFSLASSKDPMFKDDEQWQRFIRQELVEFLYAETRRKMTSTGLPAL